jgi:hypothetical protein
MLDLRIGQARKSNAGAIGVAQRNGVGVRMHPPHNKERGPRARTATAKFKSFQSSLFLSLLRAGDQKAYCGLDFLAEGPALA